MAKFNFETAVAFAQQSAEGTYNATLDGITTSLSYTQGLLLGSPSAGIRQSGLNFGTGRGFSDKAFIGSSFTRPLSDFLQAEVPTFTFAFPFCGNRGTASTPPVDGDAVALGGIDALLVGCGMIGAAWGSGVGIIYTFEPGDPISALLYVSGRRIELLDCRVAMEIVYTPGEIPIATATVAVGSIKDHSLAAIPSTLTYGPQASVSAAKVVSVANAWQDTRGFSTATLNIGNTIEDIGDSNQTTGFVKEQTDREVTFSGTLYADDTVNKGYEYSQIIAASEGTLDALSFTVGPAMTDGSTILAHRIVIPLPEARQETANALGTKAAYDVELVARGAAAGGGNDELQILFI